VRKARLEPRGKIFAFVGMDIKSKRKTESGKLRPEQGKGGEIIQQSGVTRVKNWEVVSRRGHFKKGKLNHNRVN